MGTVDGGSFSALSTMDSAFAANFNRAAVFPVFPGKNLCQIGGLPAPPLGAIASLEE